MSRVLRSVASWASRARGRPVRVPAGLGCLLPLIVLPIALIAMFVTLLHLLHALIGGRSRAARLPSEQEAALRSFVDKMALDDEFDVDDARMAGLPADAGVDVDALLRHALRRGWVEQRGDVFAVTPQGRAATRDA